LLAQALGGVVEANPRGREIGTTILSVLERDPLFGGCLQSVPAQVTHVDSVVRPPERARVLARTEVEPHAALRFSEWSWGVQFHPEIDEVIMGHYLDARHAVLAREGFDVGALRATLRPAPEAAEVLGRFAAEVTRKERDSRLPG
jgi:GMP synthase (glutamine-hydrolysing)